MLRFSKKVWRFIRRKQKQRQENKAFKNAFNLRAQSLADNRFTCAWEDIWPCLDDATSNTGFDAHYLYHTAWAIRILAATKPVKHTDIGSCLRFVSMASALAPINFYDYRPANITLSNLFCGQADLLQLPFPDASIASLSCMHVVEHIGMERYGDAFDPEGDLKAIDQLNRVLASGGQLLFVVPVGEVARIQYNAHRIYTYDQILSYFPDMRLQNFAVIQDSGDFIENATASQLSGQKYACGCFHFIKG